MCLKDSHLTSFNDFGLAEPLLKALTSEGYSTPTPIQTKAIPLVMTGQDLLGIAQTGTGKTAAFALPVLHRFVTTLRPRLPRACRALVLSPTRELASQIAESFKSYGKNSRLSTAVVFGGVPIGRQERMMQMGVDVLVATPGRLLDLIDRRAVSLSDIEVLVLDEADQMLDLGFIHALKRIVTLVPKKRQSLFFSATMPKAIADLAAQFLTNPLRVEVAPVATTAERVDQHVIFVAAGRKQPLLIELLKDTAITRTLVFTRTKHGADKVVRSLESAGISAAAIHGNKSQSQRERALSDFKTGRCRVLVATDIAARGIDIDAVSHVFNYELPNVPEQYVHRIGRTARAGATGIAISFCNGEERAYLRDIEKLTRLDVPQMAAPEGFDLGRDDAQTETKRKPQQNRGGGRGQEGRGQEGRSEGRSGDGRGFGGGRGQQGRSLGGGRSDAPRADFGRTDEARDARVERTRFDPLRQDGPRQEGARQDGPRQEHARSDAPRNGAPRQDSRRDAPARHADPRRDGPAPRASEPRGDARGPDQRVAWLDRAKGQRRPAR